MLFDNKDMPQIKKAQFIVKEIWVGVHPTVTDGTFSVGAVAILALICIFCILVEFKIVIEEVSIYQNCRDHGRAVGT